MRQLPARDRIRVVEQVALPQDTRLCAVPHHLEFDRGTVFAPKLIVNNYEGRNHRAVSELFWHGIGSDGQ